MICANKRHPDLATFDRLSHEEVSTLYVFGSLMMFWIVGQVNCPLIIDRERDRRRVTEAQLGEES